MPLSSLRSWLALPCHAVRLSTSLLVVRRLQFGAGSLYCVGVWRWLFTLVFSLLWLPSIARAGELVVTFLDVGQGDAALITSPTGKRILIDGGPPTAENRLLSALQSRGVSSIDLLILSHPHLDHLGGLKKVVSALPVRMFLDGGYPSTSPGYVGLLKLLSARGVALKESQLDRKIDIGDEAALTILGPPQPFLEKTRSDINANSVVVRLSWRQRTALFTGDSEPQTEQWLLERPAPAIANLHAELLKVAHHGGKYSSTIPFLRAVQPQLAVISVAAVNDYGHPTPEALARLGQVGARIFRTDLHSDITASSHEGQPWQIKVTRGSGSSSSEVRLPAGPLKPPSEPTSLPSPNPSSSEFIASSRTQVFHSATCVAAQKIVLANRLHFATRAAALASGRRPAEDCHP